VGEREIWGSPLRSKSVFSLYYKSALLSLSSLFTDDSKETFF
jgi:hypothetical protein